MNQTLSEWRLECDTGAQVVEDSSAAEGDILSRRGRGLHQGDHDALHVVFPDLHQLGPDGDAPPALGIVRGLADVRQVVEGAGVLRASRAAEDFGLWEEQVGLEERPRGDVRDADAGDFQNLGSVFAQRRALHCERDRRLAQDLGGLVLRRVADQRFHVGPRDWVAERNRVLFPRAHSICHPRRREILVRVPAATE